MRHSYQNFANAIEFNNKIIAYGPVKIALFAVQDKNLLYSNLLNIDSSE
jgi:hypothetical protein